MQHDYDMILSIQAVARGLALRDGIDWEKSDRPTKNHYVRIVSDDMESFESAKKRK